MFTSADLPPPSPVALSCVLSSVETNNGRKVSRIDLLHCAGNKKSSLLIINFLEGRVDGQLLKYMLFDCGFVY